METELWWEIIEEALGSDRLPRGMVWRLFSDSVVSVADALELVQSHLQRGYCGHCRIMKRFLDDGAILEVTEDDALYDQFFATITNKKGGQKLLRNRLVKRDRFIARRINEALKSGEWGILLIGTAHKDVYKFLAPDIVRHCFLTAEDNEKFALRFFPLSMAI